MVKSVKQVQAALSMLKPSEVRRAAVRRVNIGLVSSTEAGYVAMEGFLLANLGPRLQVHRADARHVPENVDLVLYEQGMAAPEGGYTFHPRDTGWIDAILSDHKDLGLALANQFPVFREPVVRRTIQEVARENAVFALATAMPNVVPNVLELPWVVGEFASDTVFLTVNQMRMAFMIAAAHGREPGFKVQSAPMLTIAGGAFGWRALARELVGKIPLGGGLIPKSAIAYAGTVLVGKALDYYYRHNLQFTPAQREATYLEAYERGKGVAEELRRETT
jgi:hypothetical protein